MCYSIEFFEIMEGSNCYDENHLRSLYDRYGRELYQFAVNLLGDEMEAEDVIQEFFIKFWHKNSDEISSFKSYAYKSVYNACISLIRTKQKSPIFELLDNSQEIAIEDQSLHDEKLLPLLQQLDKAIESLPDRCKLIFKMVYFEDKTYAEVAEILSLSTNTIKVQMSKAYRLIRTHCNNFSTVAIFMLLCLLVQRLPILT